MADLGVQGGLGKESRYYIAQHRASDYLLRCKDCRQLVLLADIKVHGCCPCGNKRFVEITTLTPAEKTTVEAMEFPYKAEFLGEFEARG